VINQTVYPLRLYHPASTPNDPLADQWGFTHAKLPQAWDTPRGTNDTVLAIIDTGFALQHEEFTNRWYTNSGESGAATNEAPSLLNCTDRGLPLDANCNLVDDDSNGIVDDESGVTGYENPSQYNCTDQLLPLTKDCNRIDDDGNGYIDDVSGWDFINGDRTPQAGELNPTGTGTTHGTKVAGLAAATGNNSKGIAGVDWGTKILPLQALDDDAYGDTLSVGRAINYAVTKNVDVISLSVGSTLADPYVEQAVRAATAAGITVVAAAGNDGCSCILYPANYPEVVAVGALDTNEQRADFSAFGPNLDVVAPGVNMTSSSWTSSSPTDAYATSLNGTSFAAPMVSGLLTRLLSQHSDITPLQLTAIMAETTNPLGTSSSAPHSDTIGFGAINAQASTARAATPFSPRQLYTFSNISTGAHLTPSLPMETTGDYMAYQCPSSVIGRTAIYTLTKGSQRFFSLSPTEMSYAKANGYTSALFLYACLLQPHDTPQAIRELNTKREF
jgi:hypothetical protein